MAEADDKDVTALSKRRLEELAAVEAERRRKRRVKAREDEEQPDP